MRLTTEACSPVLPYTSVCTPMPQKMCVPQHTAQTLPVPDVRKTSQRACEVVAPFTTGSHSFSAFAFVCLSRVSSSRRESAFIADQSEPNGQRKGGAWQHGSPHQRDWTRSSARLACNGLAGGNVVAEDPQASGRPTLHLVPIFVRRLRGLLVWAACISRDHISRSLCVRPAQHGRKYGVWPRRPLRNLRLVRPSPRVLRWTTSLRTGFPTESCWGIPRRGSSEQLYSKCKPN